MGYFYDVMSSILIVIIFFIVFIGLYIASLAKKIEENWPLYKCQPAVIPLAGLFGKDALKNFTECIGDIQSGFIDTLLGPVKKSMSSLGDIGKNVVGSVETLRLMFKFLTDALANVFVKIFGMLNNTVISFQQIVMGLKDLLMKLVGVFYSMAMILNGSIIFGESIMAGPIGGVVDFFCFSPKTKIKLLNGKYKCMKDLNLGEILEDRSEVKGILRIKGDIGNKYYKIFSKELDDYIYVTGSHLIFDDDTRQFIEVEKYKKAILTDLWDKEMSCLVTSTNNIPIGEYTFWDWED
jgi:hypothetical protein